MQSSELKHLVVAPNAETDSSDLPSSAGLLQAAHNSRSDRHKSDRRDRQHCSIYCRVSNVRRSDGRRLHGSDYAQNCHRG